jgi:uncharacterized protein YabE (DUF348 family)
MKTKKKNTRTAVESPGASKEPRRLRHHPFVVPVITFLALFFMTSIGLVLFNGQTVKPEDLHVVSLTVDTQKQTFPTRAKTVKDLLAKQNIEVNEQDIIEPSLDTKILEDNFSVNVYKARPVTIEDKGRKITVLSAYKDPRTIAEKAGITLTPEDGIVQAPIDDITNQDIIGENLAIDRAITVQLNLYGARVPVRTREDTVKGLLESKNINLATDQQVFPGPDTKLTPELNIVVANTGKRVEVIEEAIGFETETRNDPLLPAGETKVIQEGVPGMKVVVYEVTQDGTAAKVPLQQFESRIPIKKIIVKGSKAVILGTRGDWLIGAGVSPAEYAAVDYIISKESGWCPTKWQGEYGGCPAYHGTPTSAGVGYGLCQATPGYKMASAGADWATNPVTQLRWCTDYARRRYSGWQQAYNFWVVNRWW